MNKPIKNFWIILALILFFPLGLILMWAKTNWNSKTKWAVTGVCGFLIILSAITNAVTPNSQDTKQVASVMQNTQSQPTATEAVATDTPTPQGLGITRAYLMSKFQQAAQAGGLGTIDFSQGTPVNGQDNYTAQAGQNIIQLIGSADDLSEVSSTALIGDTSTTGDNMKALVFVFGLGNLVDSNSGNWITTTMKAESTSGQDTDNQSTVINGRKYELDMGTIGTVQSYTLTIDPAQ
ncbi:MAG: hypothetical protein ACRDFB_05105 [Rhabdochlamydiaceae bacterium]